MIILSTNLYQSWKKSTKSNWNNLKLLIIKFEISFEFKKKTISSNLQLILLHSAFTPIKFSPTYLHQKNIQSRGQNQGKRTKENLKSNSRSNFSIREVLYTAISLWTIETFLIAQEGYYENLDAKSPCGEQVRIQFTWHVSMGILLIRVSTG